MISLTESPARPCCFLRPGAAGLLRIYDHLEVPARRPLLRRNLEELEGAFGQGLAVAQKLEAVHVQVLAQIDLQVVNADGGGSQSDTFLRRDVNRGQHTA